MAKLPLIHRREGITIAPTEQTIQDVAAAKQLQFQREAEKVEEKPKISIKKQKTLIVKGPEPKVEEEKVVVEKPPEAVVEEEPRAPEAPPKEPISLNITVGAMPSPMSQPMEFAEWQMQLKGESASHKLAVDTQKHNENVDKLNKDAAELNTKSIAFDKKWSPFIKKSLRTEAGVEFTGTEEQFKEYSNEASQLDNLAGVIRHTAAQADKQAATLDTRSKAIENTFFHKIETGEFVPKFNYRFMSKQDKVDLNKLGVTGFAEKKVAEAPPPTKREIKEREFRPLKPYEGVTQLAAAAISEYVAREKGIPEENIINKWTTKGTVDAASLVEDKLMQPQIRLLLAKGDKEDVNKIFDEIKKNLKVQGKTEAVSEVEFEVEKQLEIRPYAQLGIDKEGKIGVMGYSLDGLVRDSMKKGQSHEQIVERLSSYGFKTETVDLAAIRAALPEPKLKPNQILGDPDIAPGLGARTKERYLEIYYPEAFEQYKKNLSDEKELGKDWQKLNVDRRAAALVSSGLINADDLKKDEVWRRGQVDPKKVNRVYEDLTPQQKENLAGGIAGVKTLLAQGDAGDIAVHNLVHTGLYEKKFDPDLPYSMQIMMRVNEGIDKVAETYNLPVPVTMAWKGLADGFVGAPAILAEVLGTTAVDVANASVVSAERQLFPSKIRGKDVTDAYDRAKSSLISVWEMGKESFVYMLQTPKAMWEDPLGEGVYNAVMFAPMALGVAKVAGRTAKTGASIVSPHGSFWRQFAIEVDVAAVQLESIAKGVAEPMVTRQLVAQAVKDQVGGMVNEFGYGLKKVPKSGEITIAGKKAKWTTTHSMWHSMERKIKIEGVGEVRVRLTPAQKMMPDVLYHHTGDVKAFFRDNQGKSLPEMIQFLMKTKGEPGFYMSPQIPLKFRALGPEAVNPGTVAIRITQADIKQLPAKTLIDMGMDVMNIQELQGLGYQQLQKAGIIEVTKRWKPSGQEVGTIFKKIQEHPGMIEAEMVGGAGTKLYAMKPNWWSKTFGKTNGATYETFTTNPHSGKFEPMVWLRTKNVSYDVNMPSTVQMYANKLMALEETIKDLPYTRMRPLSIKFGRIRDRGPAGITRSIRTAYKSLRDYEAEIMYRAIKHVDDFAKEIAPEKLAGDLWEGNWIKRVAYWRDPKTGNLLRRRVMNLVLKDEKPNPKTGMHEIMLVKDRTEGAFGLVGGQIDPIGMEGIPGKHGFEAKWGSKPGRLTISGAMEGQCYSETGVHLTKVNQTPHWKGRTSEHAPPGTYTGIAVAEQGAKIKIPKVWDAKKKKYVYKELQDGLFWDGVSPIEVYYPTYQYIKEMVDAGLVKADISKLKVYKGDAKGKYLAKHGKDKTYNNRMKGWKEQSKKAEVTNEKLYQEGLQKAVDDIADEMFEKNPKAADIMRRDPRRFEQAYIVNGNRLGLVMTEAATSGIRARRETQARFDDIWNRMAGEGRRRTDDMRPSYEDARPRSRRKVTERPRPRGASIRRIDTNRVVEQRRFGQEKARRLTPREREKVRQRVVDRPRPERPRPRIRERPRVERPPERVPPRIKRLPGRPRVRPRPPEKRPPFILPPEERKEEERRRRGKYDGGVAFQMGRLKAGRVFHILTYPFAERDYEIYVGENPPHGVRVVKDPRAAFETVQELYGVTPRAKIDIGIVDVDIKPGIRRPQLRFTGDPKRQTRHKYSAKRAKVHVEGKGESSIRRVR